MPIPDDKVRLYINGHVHSDWTSYDVDSDLLKPADAWNVTLGFGEKSLPSFIKKGQPVDVRMDNDLVMVGRIDDVDDLVSKESGVQLYLSGRDKASTILDCSAPIFTAREVTLEEIVAKVVRPLGIDKIRIDADSTEIRKKINVEPGDSAWQVVSSAAYANGLWLWFDPDGTLVIGGPDYTEPPVATLILRANGKGNNVEWIRRHDSIHGRFSEVTVLGQTHGTSFEPGRHNMKVVVKDEGVEWYRPRIIVDHEADSSAIARDRARGFLADSRLRGFTISAGVNGHRIYAPGEASHGMLWNPGQRIHVICERHGTDDIFFLTGRRFIGGKNKKPQTVLTLKEDKTWALDAHPQKRKHRLKKNSGPGQIVDASKGAA